MRLIITTCAMALMTLALTASGCKRKKKPPKLPPPGSAQFCQKYPNHLKCKKEEDLESKLEPREPGEAANWMTEAESEKRKSKAKKTGVLDVLRQPAGSRLKDLFSRKSPVSKEAEKALGSLKGLKIGDGPGLGGLGLGNAKGTGNGKGRAGLGGWDNSGTGGGGVSLGSLGTIGGKKLPPKLAKRFSGALVRMGYTQVYGQVMKRRVVRNIEMYLPQIRYCYVLKGLAKNPKLKGKVTVEFVLTPKGRPTNVKIGSSTLKHAPLHKCIKAVVKRWRILPVLGLTVAVKQTFRFYP